MPSSAWAREKAEAVCADSVWTDELVERMAAVIDEAEAARLKWAIALQSLTPGGSEFQTPEACVAAVRHRYQTAHDRLRIMKQGRDDARAELARLRERIREAAEHQLTLRERARSGDLRPARRPLLHEDFARVLRGLLEEGG